MANYLPVEAIALLKSLVKAYPVGSLGMALFIIGGIYGILKWKFNRGGTDLFIVATGLSGIAALVGACLWILVRSPGYRVF